LETKSPLTELPLKSESEVIKYDRQVLRSDRKIKVEQLRRLIGTVVPNLFLKAHLRDFSKQFQSLLFDREPDQGIVFWGSPGVGKSHCMAALARKFILTHKTCKRITYEMLCLKIRDTYQSNSANTELSVIQPLIDCSYLFIEDVGTTRSIGKTESDFSLRAFLVLLDGRLEACRPTFITTNKSVENLGDSFDERVASRLSSFKVIRMAGRDKRKC